jgi:hypothetical protein
MLCCLSDATMGVTTVVAGASRVNRSACCSACDRLCKRPRPRAQEASMIRLLAALVRLKVAHWRLERRIAQQ